MKPQTTTVDSLPENEDEFIELLENGTEIIDAEDIIEWEEDEEW
jgi:hypothetical protein